MAGSRSRCGWNGWSCLNSVRSDRHAHKASVPPYAPPASVKGRGKQVRRFTPFACALLPSTRQLLIPHPGQAKQCRGKRAGGLRVAHEACSCARPHVARQGLPCALESRRAAQARTEAFWTCLFERSEFKHGQPFWPEPRSVRPTAGDFVGTRSFGFFWIVCQKKLALQARSAWAKRL